MLEVLANFPSQHLFKFNYRNTKATLEICSKLAIKTPERHHWFRSVVFIVNHWTDFAHCVCVFIVGFEQVNIGWVRAIHLKSIDKQLHEKYRSNSWITPEWTTSALCLTHFQPMFHFYTSWKHQKTYCFLMFPGGIEWNIGWKWDKVFL